MINKTVFTATEARQNFFELLQLAEAGKEPIIVKKDSKVNFRVVTSPKKKKKDIKKILKEMGEIGLKSMPWSKMEKIIETMHDPTI